jgi:hypothetical protein
MICRLDEVNPPNTPTIKPIFLKALAWDEIKRQYSMELNILKKWIDHRVYDFAHHWLEKFKIDHTKTYEARTMKSRKQEFTCILTTKYHRLSGIASTKELSLKTAAGFLFCLVASGAEPISIPPRLLQKLSSAQSQCGFVCIPFQKQPVRICPQGNLI